MDQFNYGIDLVKGAKDLGYHFAELQRELGVYHVAAGLGRDGGSPAVYVSVELGAAIATLALEAFEADALAFGAAL